MDAALEKKLEKVKAILRGIGSCIVACSGGVDSCLLLAVAHEILGDRCVGVIARGPIFPDREFREAVQWAETIGARLDVVELDVLTLPAFQENPPDRCYHCKKTIFSHLIKKAKELGAAFVVDGTNADDVRDYRPGIRALKELGVRSPWLEADVGKEEIRALAREVYRLPQADSAPMACLASRVPYGQAITEQKLRQIEAVENALADAGFHAFRARHHGDIVRIEVPPSDIERAASPPVRNAIVRAAKAQGFLFVTLDLEGYRTGSLNDAIRSSSST